MDDPASLFLLLSSEQITQDDSSFTASTLINFALVVFLVLANGFFVAAEFAFVAVRKSRIAALAAEGSASAKRLMELLNDLNAYLSASQLGITLASLGLGRVGEPTVAAVLERLFQGSISDSALHVISFLVGFGLITSLHIVVGEQAPKLIGLQVAEKVAMASALPMKIFYVSFKPFIYLLNWTSAKTVSIFGFGEVDEHDSVYTEDEILQLIARSQESGQINEEERELISKVFEFSETTVKEAMIPRTEVVAVPESVGYQELAAAFRESGYSRMPVYRESLDEVAGVIHSKDLVGHILDTDGFDLTKLLHKPNYVVDTARLEDVLRQMQKEKFHFGFVVDEHGGVEGIITLEDLLEEIVGDISDEHDEEVNEQIDEQPNGAFLLDGSLAVRDLNKRLELHLPVSDGYTTVAGFLMSEAGELLAEGETVPFNGHIFTVERVEKHRIMKVRMEKAQPEINSDEA
jgi:CBS domain containing-hemolysin-like protein